MAPYRFDFKTLQNGLNFTLTSDLGDVGLFGELPRGEVYQNLLQESIEVHLADDVSIQVADLDALIRLKNTAAPSKGFNKKL